MGALHLLPEGSVPPDIHTIEAQRLNTHDVAAIIRSIKAGGIPEDFQEEPFRIALAGAQEKTALLFHEGFGMDVAKTDIATFEDQKVLVVERFDRHLYSDRTWWMRLPQEDLCQATGTQASMKYESEGGPGISSLMKLLLNATDPQANRKKFLKAQVLFWLLAAYPVLGHGVGMIPKQTLKMAMAATMNGPEFPRGIGLSKPKGWALPPWPMLSSVK